MSLSSPGSYEPFVETLISSGPRFKSFLDVGCGMGHYGLAARMYASAWHHQDQDPDPAMRNISLVGVDINETTILPHHRSLYDQVLLGGIQDLISHLQQFDVVWIGDCIEHMKDEIAIPALKNLWEHTEQLLMLATVKVYTLYETKKLGTIHASHRSAWPPEKVAEVLGCPISVHERNRQYFMWAWKTEPCTFRDEMPTFEVKG